jgi:hypothetical protein
MEIMSTSTACSRQTASHLVEQAIRLGAARPDDRVTIVGGGEIEVMIALASHGFLEVDCRGAARVGLGGRGTADCVIVPAVDNETKLAGLLKALGAALRPGGTLVLNLPNSMSRAAEKRLQACLLQHRFGQLRAAVDPDGGETLCCCWLPAAHAAQAQAA